MVAYALLTGTNKQANSDDSAGTGLPENFFVSTSFGRGYESDIIPRQKCPLVALFPDGGVS